MNELLREYCSTGKGEIYYLQCRHLLLFEEDHFFDLGEGTGFKFIEIDCGRDRGSVEGDGIIAGLFE
jgi:hypothetical protein